MTTTTAIFVYGTLQPGQLAYAEFCRNYEHFAMPAIVYGQLYDLPLGYPALVPGGEQPVYGTCLQFADPAILAVLDDYEQHDRAVLQATYPQIDADWAMTGLAYGRQQLPILTPTETLDLEPIAQAWVYTMTLAQITQLQGKPCTAGRWPLVA
jgi:gamma-glutamylcyclotransferase (GGCT)/AIG2-like uncharacterized protein YtfP